MKRTPHPGRRVSVCAPPAALRDAAALLASDGGIPLAAGRCETNAHYLATAATTAGRQAEIVIGFWDVRDGLSQHVWARVDGLDMDPSAALCGYDPARVEYFERICCSDEEAEARSARHREWYVAELADQRP